MPQSKPEKDQEEPGASTGKELRKRAQPEQAAVKGHGKSDVLVVANDRKHDGSKPASAAASRFGRCACFSGQSMLYALNAFPSGCQ